MAIKDEVLAEIRTGIMKFEAKNASGDHKIPDATLEQFIDDALSILSLVKTKRIPADVKKLAVKLLAQHLCLMSYDETVSLGLPNNSETWAAKPSGLQLDLTPMGQMFKVIIKRYTNMFESPDDLAKTPQHLIKIWS